VTVPRTVTLTVKPPAPQTANVRFVNATTGMAGSGGFTANGQFAAGSALALGQSTQCSAVSAGSTAFGFGAANPGGTGLSGSALATSSGQSITVGGSYIVAATGPATGPTIFLLDDSYSGTLPSNRAAVRFVNLAPGTSTTPNNFAIFLGTFGAGGTLHAANPAVGAPTTFTAVPSGSNAFSVIRNHEVPPAITGTPGTLNLQAGSVNTIAIVPTASGGVQLVNLPRC
jgi:hypothetical protein